ncbi:MAG: hypothetical protein Q8K37_00405 [Alphaproteobacteria bacterium]|nr:hypothetical protein [Alphaproteobacteria bacterium]
MFLKSPRKFTFASLTFALVLSTNLLFSGESFAVGPQEYFNDGLKKFDLGFKEQTGLKQKLFTDAQTLFTFAHDEFTKDSIGQAESKLFWARTNALIDGPINAIPLFKQAVELYRIAEKDALEKNGLADALFYQAENNLAIEVLKKDEARKIVEGSSSKKRKLAYANEVHDEAKTFLEESLNLPQTPDLKIRSGGKLAYLWTEDKDNQKAKDTLLKIVNVMSDANLRAGTQKEIIDFCLELEGKTQDANYQSAKDALVKIVDEIVDPEFKAKTQQQIGEFFYTVKELPNTIFYLTKARDYFGKNTSWYGYTPLDAEAVGEINELLQHTKFLTGLYNQSIEDGLAAEKWLKASIESQENKEEWNRALLSNLHLLGNAYLKMHENDPTSGYINNAESTFYELNNLLITLLANTEENKGLSQSLFLDADSLKKLSENSDYVDLLYAYQIRSNISLMYTKIHQNNYADAASNLRLAEEKIKLLNDAHSENTVKRVIRASLAVDSARLYLRIFETEGKGKDQRVARLNNLVSKWSSVSPEQMAPYYAPRHLWRLEMTLGDASFHMNDIEAAKTHYIAAITEARKAGYKHFEMTARDRLALMLDQNAKAELKNLETLEKELADIKAEKTVLVKEVTALKKAKSDQEEAKNAEIVAKESVIKEKEAPIATLKAAIAGFTANRNRESNIADKLKLSCELRSKTVSELTWGVASYSEDDQKLYLTYFGEAPALNIDPALNSSQIVDDYQDVEVKPVAELPSPKENLAKVVEELKETLVLPDESSEVKEDVALDPVEEVHLEEIVSFDGVNQESAQPLDLFAGNLFDTSEVISDDEQDENSAKMTDFLNQLAQVHEERSSDSLVAKLTNDFPDLTSLELWSDEQSEKPSVLVQPSVLIQSLPDLEDLGAYLGKEFTNDVQPISIVEVKRDMQAGTVLGAPKTKSKAPKINHAPAMQRIIDKKRWNPKKSKKK